MATAWGEITAGEISAPISGTMVSGEPQTVFAGLSSDSRKIRRGELFWALSGERYDGHDFIQKAIDQGAAGIVVQKGHKILNSAFRDQVVIAVDNTLRAMGDLAGWWRHQHPARVVAITGSTGKTTTKEMTAGILGLGNSTLKNQGNFNNLVGLPLTLLQVEKRHRNLVLEMGMNRPREIARLTEIADPDVGVITNVGMAHLEGLGNLEGVAKAKLELVEKISSRSKVILNGDDELLMKMGDPFQKHVTTFGLGEKNDVRATRIEDFGRGGVSFHLKSQERSLPIRLKTPGVHNVFNALAAAAAGLCLNESWGHIVDGLGLFEGVKGRFMMIALPGDIILMDDTHNANPSSLEAAIDSVKSLTDEGARIIVGLGEMMELGDATAAAHLEAGSKVAELRPRRFMAIGEHAHEMIRGAEMAGMSMDLLEVVETHEEMVRKIIDDMRQGDLIFLKASRRMGLERVVEGLKEAFS